MFEAIKNLFGIIGNALAPFAYGLAFAFLVLPVYKKLNKKLPKALCSIICLLILMVAIALLLLLIVPQFIDSVSAILNQLPLYIEALDGLIGKLFERYPGFAETIETHYSSIGDSVVKWVAGEMLPNLNGYIASISSGVWSIILTFKNFIIGFIVMIYFLNMKDVTKARAKKMVYGFLPIDKANLFLEDCRFTFDVFSNFLIGKIIDSVIIGILTFIVVSICKIPYAPLIAIIVGVTNIIPFFGPFIGAIPCALLLLAVSPVKCLEFCIIILVIQQLDGNVIGPKILGERTGVSSFWVLFSILLFGGLFGFVGMIIAVPTFAVIYRIIKRAVYSKLTVRNLSTNTEDYSDLKKIDEVTKEYINNDTT
ncbi:MAG: AI-2E family transporter [Lachnospiraceae bacterium]|nr:AI-2E family transporter [Lachnospiraceae bacterium]